MRSWAAIIYEYECARYFLNRNGRSNSTITVNTTQMQNVKHQRRWSSSSSSSLESTYLRRPERIKKPLENVRATILSPPPPETSPSSELSSRKLSDMLRSYLTKTTSKLSLLTSHNGHDDNSQTKHEREILAEVESLHLLNNVGSAIPTITYFNHHNNTSNNTSINNNKEKIFTSHVRYEQSEEPWEQENSFFNLKENEEELEEEEVEGSEWRLHKDVYSKLPFFNNDARSVNSEVEEENENEEHSDQLKNVEEWSEERVTRTLNMFSNIIQVQMEQQRQDRQRQRYLWKQRSMQEQIGFTRNCALHSVKQTKLTSEQRELLQELLDYLISGNLPFVRRGAWGSAGCRIAWETGEYSRCCELYFRLRPLCPNYHFFKWASHFELIITAAGGSLKYSFLMQCWDVIQSYANGGVEENEEWHKLEHYESHELEEEELSGEECSCKKMQKEEKVREQSIISETKLANCTHKDNVNKNNNNNVLSGVNRSHLDKHRHALSYCSQSPIAVPLTVRLYMICIFYLYHYIGIDFTLLPIDKRTSSPSPPYLSRDKHASNTSLTTIAHDTRCREHYSEDMQRTNHVCEVYKLTLKCLKKCLPASEMCKNEYSVKSKRNGNNTKNERNESSAAEKSGSAKIVLLRNSNIKNKKEASKKPMFLSNKRKEKFKSKQELNKYVYYKSNKKSKVPLTVQPDKSELETFVINSLRKFHYKVYDVIEDTYNSDNNINNNSEFDANGIDNGKSSTMTIEQRRKQLCIHSTEVDAGFLSIWEQFIAKWNSWESLKEHEEEPEHGNKQEQNNICTNIVTNIQGQCCYYNWWQNVWVLHSLMRRLLYTNYVMEANHIIMYADLYFIAQYGQSNVNSIDTSISHTIVPNGMSRNEEIVNNNNSNNDGALVIRPDTLQSEKQQEKEKLRNEWEREQEVECDVENALVISLAQIWERQAKHISNTDSNTENDYNNTALLWLKRWLTQNFDYSLNTLCQMQNNNGTEPIKCLENSKNNKAQGKLYNDLLARVAQCAAVSNDVETIMYCLQEMLHNGYSENTSSHYNIATTAATTHQHYSQYKTQEEHQVAHKKWESTSSISSSTSLESKEKLFLHALQHTYNLTSSSMSTSPTSRHLKTCLHALVKCHYPEWMNVYEVLREHELLSLHDEEFLYWQLYHISHSVKCEMMLNVLLQRSLPIYGVNYSNRSLSTSSLSSSSSSLPQQEQYEEQLQYSEEETNSSTCTSTSSGAPFSSSENWLANHQTCIPDKLMTTVCDVNGEVSCSEIQDNISVEHRPFVTENILHQTHLLTPRCVELLLELLIRCHHSALLRYYRYFVTHAGHKCGLSSRVKWLEMILCYWHTTWPSCPFYMENVKSRVKDVEHNAVEQELQQHKELEEENYKHSNTHMKTYAQENTQKSKLISDFNYTCDALEDHLLFIMSELVKVLEEKNAFTKERNYGKSTCQGESYNSATLCTNKSLENCNQTYTKKQNCKINSNNSSNNSINNLHRSPCLRCNCDALDTLTVTLAHVKVLCIQYGHSNLEHWLTVNTSPAQAKEEIHALFRYLRNAKNLEKKVESTCNLLNAQWLDEHKNVRRYAIANEDKIHALEIFRNVTNTQNLLYGTSSYWQNAPTTSENSQSSKKVNDNVNRNTHVQTNASNNIWLSMQNQLHATETRIDWEKDMLRW